MRNRKTIIWVCILGLSIYFWGYFGGHSEGYHLGMKDCLETHIAEKKGK